MNFPIWPIVFLIHSLGIPIFVVHVRVFLDMGVGLHGGWEDLYTKAGKLTQRY